MRTEKIFVRFELASARIHLLRDNRRTTHKMTVHSTTNGNQYKSPLRIQRIQRWHDLSMVCPYRYH
jgi:hypothetical protein